MAHRFHVVGLPHTRTSRETNTCAYTVKVYNFCQMMASLGHTVYHYGAEGSDPTCAEHITTVSAQQQRSLYDGPIQAFPFDHRHPLWVLCNTMASFEIGRRAEPHDFLCLIGGTTQKHIADQHPKMMAVEYGIGYGGVFAPYKVFESYAHQALIYGQRGPDPNGSFYDAVIPNSFNVADFSPPDEHLVGGRPFLYLGRMIQRKGIRIAVAAAARAGRRLILAGTGARAVGNKVVADDGEVYAGDNLEYVGPADVAARRKLMGEAEATFVPTEYLEPFGGVAVESQLCGTPVITTDWGAFPETVKHGVTGFRCRTLEQFVWAAKNVYRLDRAEIRRLAVANYSTDRVKHMYQEYFDMLAGLWGVGWYGENEQREQLDWLRKE